MARTSYKTDIILTTSNNIFSKKDEKGKRKEEDVEKVVKEWFKSGFEWLKSNELAVRL